MTAEGRELQRDESAFLLALRSHFRGAARPILPAHRISKSYRGPLSRDSAACLQKNPSPRRPSDTRRGKQRVLQQHIRSVHDGAVAGATPAALPNFIRNPQPKEIPCDQSSVIKASCPYVIATNPIVSPKSGRCGRRASCSALPAPARNANPFRPYECKSSQVPFRHAGRAYQGA